MDPKKDSPANDSGEAPQNATPDGETIGESGGASIPPDSAEQGKEGEREGGKEEATQSEAVEIVQPPEVEGMETMPSKQADEEPLPEWEELTPELLEDECLRGDVMLRWGAVLLAVLLGWTYITETNVLIQIRSGEYMASHGWLPPRTDVFSSTATDRAWINLGWLSDILLGQLYGIGFSALTVLSALTSFVAFQLLTRVNLPGVTSWWGSMCAAAAAVAVFPMLQPGSLSFTVLGLALLMWLLLRWREPAIGTAEDPPERPNGSGPALWPLPALFLVWSNLDQRAFLGLIILIAFALGATLTGGSSSKGSRGVGRLWLVTLASAVAMVVHPWHWHSLESAWVQLAVVPAEVRDYFVISEFFPRLGVSYLQAEFWIRPNLYLHTAMGLAVFALLMQLLNIRRFDGALTMAWLAAVLCGIASGQLLCYSAIVSAAVAALCGQDWYRHNFSMAYDVNIWNVLYSRAGRAVTVLLFFAVAYLAVNGALMGPAGRRIGNGLDPRWENRLDSLQKSLVEEAYDDRVFPLRIDQGDLLLWLGQKPFVDSRLSLYATHGENLLALHRATRTAIRYAGQQQAAAAVIDWKETLDRFEITHIAARLWGPNPVYDTFLVLLLQPDWAMTGLGSAGATFYRTDLSDPELTKYIQDHELNDFVGPAFRELDPETVALTRPEFPQVKSEYERWLIQPLPAPSPAIELANHYLVIAAALREGLRPEQSMALGYLALRSARQGLAQDPNQAQGWRVINQAQTVLLPVETQLYGQVPPATTTIRSTAALSALVNAVHASGGSPIDLEQLALLQYQAPRYAVSLDLFRRLQERLGGRLTRFPPGDPSAEEQQVQRQELIDQLEEHVAQVREQVTQALENESTPAQAAMIAIQNNCPLIAVEVLEKDLTALAQNPSAQLMYGGLLLEVGRTEEAWQRIEGMETLIPNPPIPAQAAGFVLEWYRLNAMVNIAAGDLDRAAMMFRNSAELRAQVAVNGATRQPFASTMAPSDQDLWPAFTATASMAAAVDFPESWAAMQFSQALMEIEQGRVEPAKRLLRELLDEYPEWSQRILAVYYLTLLTGEEIPIAPPSDEIPITPDMFAPDESTSEAEKTEPEKN